MSLKKVKVIVEMPQPKYQRELRAFLGMVNHYGKFMHKLSVLCAPLNHLLLNGIGPRNVMKLFTKLKKS